MFTCLAIEKGKIKMNKIKIIALYGKSSSGKDTMQKFLLKTIKNSHGIISCTTRPPRDYEKNGRDYYFLSNEKFEDSKDYQIIAEQLLSLEESITEYLSNDKKEWESFEIRNNIKAWLSRINSIPQYINLLSTNFIKDL